MTGLPGHPARWTLRWRLVAVLVGLFVAVSLTVAVVSTLVLRDRLVDRLDDRVQQATTRALRPDPNGPDLDGGPRGGGPLGEREPDEHHAGVDAPAQGPGTVSVSISDDGDVESRYTDALGKWRRLTGAELDSVESLAVGEEPVTVQVPGLGDFRARAVTTDGETLIAGLAMKDVTRTVSDYLTTQALATGAGIGVAAVAGGALVRRELRPLDRVAAAATRVSELPLHEGEVAVLERLPAADTDPATEVGQVGAALNRLLGHVEGALAARHESETQVRQFVADASHELRTPLASIRGYAELVRRMPDAVPSDALRAMERVESESRRMTSLVEDMLLLARLDAGRPLDRSPVDVLALAVDAVADAHAAGPDHVWRLELPDAPEHEDDDVAPALVVGDEDRLRQVLVNLLANARVHTPAGTTVVTSVHRVGDTVSVRVRDDGPGVPGELASQLFHRFTRGDAARSPGSGSSGLGLAIVDAVVKAHDGRIAVDGTPGATAFTVTLRAASGEASGEETEEATGRGAADSTDPAADGRAADAVRMRATGRGASVAT